MKFYCGFITALSLFEALLIVSAYSIMKEGNKQEQVNDILQFSGDRDGFEKGQDQ